MLSELSLTCDVPGFVTCNKVRHVTFIRVMMFLESELFLPRPTSRVIIRSGLCVSAILVAPSDGSIPFREQDLRDVALGTRGATAREVTPERAQPCRESGVTPLSTAFSQGL